MGITGIIFILREGRFSSKMLKFISLFLVSALLLTVLVFAQERKDLGYRLAVNDLMEITVYQELDLTKTVRVAPDGTISFPLLGSVSVAGLTAKELEDKLTELLAQDYLVNPQVSVLIKEYAKVFVSGQVLRPGAYELKSGLSIMEAITLAGGFTEKADPTRIKLDRKEKGAEKIIYIDGTEISEKLQKDKDILLEPNDKITVEESGTISVLGQVNKPGRFILKKKNMPVIDAIAFAGGFTDNADQTQIKLIRTLESGEKETIILNAVELAEKPTDIFLGSDDVIIVEELGMVSVVGQVKKPGRFTLKTGLTVIEAIALAGGLTDVAAPNGTQVIRIKDGRKKTIVVPVDSILKSGDKTRDIPLEPGDTIVVPESFF